ncbi:MAG: alpha-galactosidase [Treponema sp.]|nr:alpha-galactosidase [Treponema sp.]
MITYNKQNEMFFLNTPDSTYVMKVTDGYLGHAYYGSSINEDDISYLLRADQYPFYPSKLPREKLSFMDMYPHELPPDGIGDFRESAIAITSSQGNNAVFPEYESYRIYKGCPSFQGLPCVFGDNADTLEITCKDKVLGVKIILNYVVFSDKDIIVRNVQVTNESSESVYLKKCLSLSFDMDNEDFDVITLHGSWARERKIERHPIHMGLQGVISNRGETSHQEHAFIAVTDHNASWNNGRVYGVNFIYSGNFMAQVQESQFNSIRIQMGINPANFTWKLNKGETFTSPQAVLSYSNQGLNGMTHQFHNLYRQNLIRSPFKNKMRPILINNWEATYFNFNTEKLLDIAREASKDGIEMLVMDDGWFGKRDDDNSGLGDWVVNEKKIQGGLKYLVDEVNKLGMKFGIWFEPEMICPDSDLFRAHPDWAIQIKGRNPGLSRNQLVLDITRKEVRDYAYESVARILRSANIEYVKWDMNRQLCDIGSAGLPKDQMGEFFHRYVLAMYEMQNRLVTEFSYLLLENCSGGGARFDPGMLYFSPQIWTSDDTDAIERLSIQEGTALMYPLSCMGAHVSVCPNHAVGRNTPFKTRGYVALSGTFGYELDITKLSKEDRQEIPNQISLYKKFNELIREGDYYKIASYRENNQYDAWMSVNSDKSKALMTFVQVLNHANYKTYIIKISGLDENATYRITYPDEDKEAFPSVTLSGRTLKNAGLSINRMWGDFASRLIYFEKI